MDPVLNNEITRLYSSFTTDYARAAFLQGILVFTTHLNITGNQEIRIWATTTLSHLMDASLPPINTR